MQTIPAFSYLVPVVLLFGIGVPTALIATVIFAIPPAIRLTSLGIRQVPETSLEVGRSFGSTSRQLLRRVQLPLAKPAILLGVNQTIMMALGIVVIAASVGVGGLGQVVLDGLNNLNVGAALAGGLAIVALAIVLDRTTSAWGDARPEATRSHHGPRVRPRDLPAGRARPWRWRSWSSRCFIGRQVLAPTGLPVVVDGLHRSSGERCVVVDHAHVRRSDDGHHQRDREVRAGSVEEPAHRCAVVDGRAASRR